MRFSALFALILGTLPAAAHAQTVDQLSKMSIEDLARVMVTSASKRPEPLSEAAASIYVIDHDEIVGSAATSLPEVLRLAPNLQVQQIDAAQYAITSRGFNGAETANKLLVRIDGRSVYTPLFSGVFWELHAPLLEDIERVEVISGPGGTLYGPNAVNGVVSVETRDAHATIGGLTRGIVAANQQTAALRYGVQLGETGAVRVYGSYFNRADMPRGAAPRDVRDRLDGFQGGFRSDFAGGDDTFTFQGDIFDTETRRRAGDGAKGHNLLARWTRQTGDASSLSLRAYYDKYSRRSMLVRDGLETFDGEFQYNAAAGPHEFVVGAGARTTKDSFINDLNPFHLNPEERRLWVFNVFGQDTLALSDEIDVTAGVKLERSSFTGVEVLPSIRATWRPSDDAMFWGAISRAVRTPSRIDRQLENLPLLARAPHFASEKLVALEAGYRGEPSAGTSLSVSLFYNLYDDLRTTEPSPGFQLPIRLANNMEGETYGIEAWGEHQVARWWRLSLGAMAMAKDFHVAPGHVDLAEKASAGNDPAFQLLARSDIMIADGLFLNAGLRVVDDLERPRAESYVEADARLGWQVSRSVELFVAGTNLLHDVHDESGDPQRGQLIERSVYAGTRLLF
jgi:iron complex outermembrane receptor protein